MVHRGREIRQRKVDRLYADAAEVKSI